MATDVALSLGIVALLARRLPPQVRALLLGLAVIDDIGAVLVTALYYTQGLAIDALLVAVVLLVLLYLFREAGIRTLTPYFAVGVIVWAAVVKSGVHPTLAGVALGALAPTHGYVPLEDLSSRVSELVGRFRRALQRGDEEEMEMLLGETEETIIASEAPLDRLVRSVELPVGYIVLPLFALANAGIPLSGAALADAVTGPIGLGVILGLVLGKPLGITLASWLSLRSGLARLPEGLSLKHVLGIGMIGGIGFTVSLFIAELAFTNRSADAEIGVLLASALAALGGYAYLRLISSD
jgi:NhaA family Na+:H+ antiporter